MKNPFEPSAASPFARFKELASALVRIPKIEVEPAKDADLQSESPREGREANHRGPLRRPLS